MQLSQLFRRGIVVPMTDHSAEQLSRWTVDDFVSVEFLSIANESLFAEIWKAGVFQSINATCSTVIADYEEEDLQPAVLERVIATLTAQQDKIKETTVRLFIESFIGLCRLALEKNRPVYLLL
jgi:hypothetical protein